MFGAVQAQKSEELESFLTQPMFVLLFLLDVDFHKAKMQQNT